MTRPATTTQISSVSSDLAGRCNASLLEQLSSKVDALSILGHATVLVKMQTGVQFALIQ